MKFGMFSESERREKFLKANEEVVERWARQLLYTPEEDWNEYRKKRMLQLRSINYGWYVALIAVVVAYAIIEVAQKGGLPWWGHLICFALAGVSGWF